MLLQVSVLTKPSSGSLQAPWWWFSQNRNM